MKIVREDINFERGQDPKTSMGIGLEARVQNLKKQDYVEEADFDDDLILYLFKDVYNEWKKKDKPAKIKSEDVEIWEDSTGGGSPIIKIKAPGLRQTTMIRGESYFHLVASKVMDLLESPKTKKEIANTINDDRLRDSGLINMIIDDYRGRGFEFQTQRSVIHFISDRLIDLLYYKKK